MKNLLRKFRHIWVLSYFALYLPWFYFLESEVRDGYEVIHITLDDLIPFNEYFVVPYLMWFGYVAIALGYFFFADKQDFFRLCTFLFVGMTVSLLICTIFPNGTDLRGYVDSEKNIFCRLVNMVRSMDTPTNVFPSIHVYNSLGVHFAVKNNENLGKRRLLRLTSFVMMALIVLSTVFIKQHSVVDVLGAMILAWFMYLAVYSTDYASSRRSVRQKVAG